MKKILVLGAGRSATVLIDYLLSYAVAEDWEVTVGDTDLGLAQEKVGRHERGRAVRFLLHDPTGVQEIQAADVVVSLLPAVLHPVVAALCLKEKKHLMTASYVSPEMRGFDAEARKAGLLFLNECGLDPGLDHMSAMMLLDTIRDAGGVITRFESFTGGLIAPETDLQNPWRYKFTWNPRNVVMAGHGVARFLDLGEIHYIPYHQLFRRITQVEVPGYGRFEGYANRDSLSYQKTYGLDSISTLLRGTLRQEGFCPAWNVLVQLGCCDESYTIDRSISPAEFIAGYLPSDTKDVKAALATYLNLQPDGPEIQRLEWSGFFAKTAIPMVPATPAQLTEYILNQKWALQESDQDMIVMWHRIGYALNGKNREVQASLVVKGEDSVRTAMAKTVGLPLAIATRRLLKNQIQLTGVQIPVLKELYVPVLEELAELGIKLEESGDLV